MNNTPEQHIVPVMPTANQYASWVAQALKDLKKRPSHFLIDPNMPGSKNRVTNFLKSPQTMQIHMASELQRQILTDAVRSGINLRPMKIIPLQSILTLGDA